MKEVILLLGAPNDDQGNLSSIAKERCDKAYEESLRLPKAQILPTGGFGAHFNTTDKPHAFYTRKYLMARGVDEARFLPSAESGNTIEDMKIAAPILEREKIDVVWLVTSDFHTERALLLAGEYLPKNVEIKPSPSVTHVSKEEMERLVAHEKKAIMRLRAQGIMKGIELPACGMLVGNAIYNSAKGYKVGIGLAYTNYSSDDATPLELTELTKEENQGNLVQYWWFNGSNRPQMRANFLALEDLGIKIPSTDWENLKNLTLEEFEAFEKYGKERAGLGVLKALKRCEEVGLYSTMIYLDGVNKEISKQFTECDRYIGYDVGERFTFRHEGGNSELKTARLDEIAKTFTEKVRKYITECKEKGYGRICTTSANFYLDYEVAAGIDFTMFEDCTMELNIPSALSRGLCRQYGLQLWGSHIANEHYQWLDYGHKYRFDTLRAEMMMKYLAGAKVIISESGAWHVQTTAGNSAQNRTPRIFRPICEQPTDEELQPYMKALEPHYKDLDHNSQHCKSYRKIMSDFYDFVKANPAPRGQPETTIAIAKGNYDLSGLSLEGRFDPNNAIGGLHELAESNPLWRESIPELGFDIATKLFWPKPKGIFGDANRNRLFSGTPYGQVDIVSFAYDQPTADFLITNYKALLFMGWNTCSQKQYQVLCEYVERGGKLFISIPHLSTDVTRSYASYTQSDLLNGGDFTELCGIKIKGRGVRFYWGIVPSYEKNELGVNALRHYGVFHGLLGDIEVLNKEAETLLFDHESCIPLVLRLPKGKGEVYFLNSWYYPGAYANEYGPYSEEGGSGMIDAVLKLIASKSKPQVYITEVGKDEPGEECAYINYSYFPDDGRICLYNIDFEKTHSIELHTPEGSREIALGGQEMRLIVR